MSLIREQAGAGCPCHHCSVVPPYMADYIRRHSRDKALLAALTATQRGSVRMRQMRSAALAIPQRASPEASRARLKRRIFSCGNSADLLLQLVREEGSRATPDPAVNEAYDHSGTVFKFFAQVFGRASVDNDNLPLTSSVHYREDPRYGFDNAFWNGQQMVYGDGQMFNRMTLCLDVIGHELTHGVTQHEAGLRYQGQSGALNEHMSDVFGVLARQWAGGEHDPARADWTIGRGLFRKPAMAGMALRSMAAPGNAYQDADFGRDQQPADMAHYVKLPVSAQGDWGGVHYNSGIPNKAFHLAALALGDAAWESAGHIWYVTLTERLRENADFRKCAYETLSVARDYHGGAAFKAVQAAWAQVGVISHDEGPRQ